MTYLYFPHSPPLPWEEAPTACLIDLLAHFPQLWRHGLRGLDDVIPPPLLEFVFVRRAFYNTVIGAASSQSGALREAVCLSCSTVLISRMILGSATFVLDHHTPLSPSSPPLLQVLTSSSQSPQGQGPSSPSTSADPTPPGGFSLLNPPSQTQTSVV